MFALTVIGLRQYDHTVVAPVNVIDPHHVGNVTPHISTMAVIVDRSFVFIGKKIQI